MKLKSFLVTFGTFVIVTGSLFLIGHMYSISLLIFDFKFVNSPDGFSLSSGSYFPLIVGLAACFFAEKIYVHRYQKNHS